MVCSQRCWGLGLFACLVFALIPLSLLVYSSPSSNLAHFPTFFLINKVLRGVNLSLIALLNALYRLQQDLFHNHYFFLLYLFLAFASVVTERFSFT